MIWLPSLGSVAVFALIWWRKPLARRAWLLASASVALLLYGIQYYLVARPESQWAMPFWLQLAYPTIHWSLVLGCVGVISGMVLVHGTSAGGICKLGVPCMALLLLAAFNVTAWQNLRPDPPPLRAPRQSSDGVVLQSSGVTCAPAAAANISTLLGRPVTEAELVDRFGTRLDGTTPAQVAYGMGRLGFLFLAPAAPRVPGPFRVAERRGTAGAPPERGQGRPTQDHHETGLPAHDTPPHPEQGADTVFLL